MSFRLLLCGAATAAWYQSAADERRNVLHRLVDACRSWSTTPGAHYIGSFDDDLFMVGDPRGHNRWSIYLLFDANRPEVGAAMIDELRREPLRLDRYFTFTVLVGRAFWPMDSPADVDRAS